MTLKNLHRLNALVLAVFLTLHFANHMLAIFGIQWHLAAQSFLRQGYRTFGIEQLLIFLFISQIILGLLLLLKRGKPQGGWAWAQGVSGVYIALFLLQHLGAILAARMMTPPLDTTSYFAAAVVSQSPFVYYFFPYYVLGITAVFTHIACALRFRNWETPASRLQLALPWVGLIIGLISVAGLTGLTAPFALPAEYLHYLNGFLPAH